MIRGDVTVALLLAATLATCGRPVRIAAPSSPTTTVPDEVREVVRLINEHRERAGCRRLEWDRTIAEVAQAHSADMVRRNFVDHTNPDGVNAFQRLARAGISYSRAAENIAAGQQTARAVFQSWIQSPGHRRNIEDCALRTHGVGYTPGAASLPYGTVMHAWANVLVRLR